MPRILISELKNKIKQKVEIAGRVLNIRKMGNISFVILQDYTGTIQVVFEKAIKAKIGDAVEISGTVKAEKRAKCGLEVAGHDLTIVSANIEELPYDFASKNLNLQLTTLLDLRPLSLRHPKVQAIFKLYDLLLEGYEKAMREEGFTEIKTPKVLEAASEGGANFFKINYFNKDAYLAQSPQLYKQIMTGVFERVFEIGTVFRAEPHFTTRHVNEYTSLDAEMGFIDSFQDIIKMLNRVLCNVFNHIGKQGQSYLQEYNCSNIEVPDKIPQIKLAKMKEIIAKEYRHKIAAGNDIDPEGEKLAGQYAKEKFNSDFIFLTHYPWETRPFYTMPDKENKEETCSFDLIYKGVELVTGSQRINDYKILIDNMKKKKINGKGLEFYLNTFKFAMPPHGGWAIGSERLIQLMLDLGSVKEATLFPRDVKRLSP